MSPLNCPYSISKIKMIHHRDRNLAIMQLVLTELERKVREEIIIQVAVDEFGVNHKPMIEHLVHLMKEESVREIANPKVWGR